DEAHVLVAPLFGLDAREFDSLFREIDSDEPAIREPGSQQVQRSIYLSQMSKVNSVDSPE
ncbi:MAG: hypothetical protein WCA06_23380, partial [Terrimicrobiaceae bacterium]